MKNMFLLLITVSASGQFAANADTRLSIFEDIYQPDSVLEITLQTDWKNFLRKKHTKEKQDALITYSSATGEVISRNISLNARGNSRLAICGFPPIDLHFKKSELEEEGFIAPFNDLKLVTHCNNVKSAEQQVLREFLAYQLYNIISPYSYRVQLVNIKYVDEVGDLFVEKMAFLIEDTDALAYRLNGKESERFNLTNSDLDPSAYAKMLLFEYMIGNTDLNLAALHNLKIIKRFSDEALIPLPYDFDYSGLVDAYYAVPNERVNQQSVKQRIIMGEFPSQGSFAQAVNEFKTAKEQLLSTCTNLSQLESREKTDVLSYLNTFFELIEDPKILSRGL